MFINLYIRQLHLSQSNNYYECSLKGLFPSLYQSIFLYLGKFKTSLSTAMQDSAIFMIMLPRLTHLIKILPL